MQELTVKLFFVDKTKIKLQSPDERRRMNHLQGERHGAFFNLKSPDLNKIEQKIEYN